MAFTTEQEFLIARFKYQVSGLNLQQSQELLVGMFISDISKTNHFRDLVKHHWFAPAENNNTEN